jgi:hypothetical protein
MEILTKCYRDMDWGWGREESTSPLGSWKSFKERGKKSVGAIFRAICGRKLFHSKHERVWRDRREEMLHALRRKRRWRYKMGKGTRKDRRKVEMYGQ